MRLPDGGTLMHAGRPYDPAKAHEYYERTKKLKGRKKGGAAPPSAEDAWRNTWESLHPGQKLPTKKKPRTTEQKIASIRKKLDLLKSHASAKSGDIQKREKAEKASAANKKKGTVASAMKDVDSVRKELSTLNEALKRKISDKAPKAEVESLKKQVDETKGKLGEAVEKLEAIKNG